MPTTRVENTRSAQASINYQIKDGRELLRSGYGVNLMDPYASFEKIYNEFNLTPDSERVQAQVLRISYKDLDPSKERDINLAHTHTDEVCRRMYGDKHIFFTVTQADGEGGKLHTHTTVCNIDYTTGKALRGEKTSWYKFKTISDEVAKEMGLEFLSPNAHKSPSQVKETKTMQMMRERGIKLSVDAFRKLLSEAIEKTTAVNFEEYQNQMEGWGIDVRYRYTKDKKVRGISYAYIDDNGDKQTMTAKGVGLPSVRPKALRKKFEKNLEKQKETEPAYLDDLQKSADDYMVKLAKDLSESRHDKEFERNF